MPELPEVETVVRTLERQIKGLTIVDIKINYSKLIENDVEDFKKSLINQTFTTFNRYAKYLIFIMSNCTLVSHLRMEGKYFIKDRDDPIEKHEHIIFYLDNGKTLRYHDVRKFGTMKVIKSTDLNEVLADPDIHKLGKEANDLTFTKEELYDLIHKLNKPIKEVLLDQTIISGLGNIYVDEVLFASIINPKTLACYLDLNDCQNILNNSRIILTKAIEAGGTTIRSYTSSLGVTGRFQLNLQVHSKVAEECPVCHNLIYKTRVGGRGTYYCIKCQKPHPHMIALAGGIASGKSTIEAYLKEKYPKFLYLDTDNINKELLNSISYQNKLIEVFEDDILTNNTFDKQKLKELVVNDNDKLEQLNKISHSEILKEMFKRIGKYQETVIVSVPLLIEAGWINYFDEVIYISVSREAQIARLMSRNNINEIEANKLIQMQLDNNVKIKYLKKYQSTLPIHFIDNDLDLCYTYRTIDEIFKN